MKNNWRFKNSTDNVILECEKNPLDYVINQKA